MMYADELERALELRNDLVAALAKFWTPADNAENTLRSDKDLRYVMVPHHRVEVGYLYTPAARRPNAPGHPVLLVNPRGDLATILGVLDLEPLLEQAVAEGVGPELVGLTVDQAIDEALGGMPYLTYQSVAYMREAWAIYHGIRKQQSRTISWKSRSR